MANNTIRKDNYKEQLKWWNESVKPNVISTYQKKFIPVTIVSRTTVDPIDPDTFFSDEPTVNRKRMADPEPIDLTNSQPKRTRHSSPSSIDLTADDNYDDFDDDFEFDNNVLNDFTSTAQPQEEEYEDLSALFPIDEDDIMDLDNMTLNNQATSLDKLKAEQLTIKSRIVELLDDNTNNDELDTLIKRRKEVTDEIKKLEDEINSVNTTVNDRLLPENFLDDDIMEDAPSMERTLVEETIVLDDDDDDDGPIEVSPFFGNQAVTKAPTPPPAPPPPIVADTQPLYEWSRDVRKALTQNFKLSEFRPNQLEAINTTLKGEDVFVLMPTGGGKSLCYQLPAIIQRYNRQGVTFVVSPLLSLMQDQVEQLVVGKGIAAGMLNSTVTPHQKKWLFADIAKPVPTTQLLYITPELLNMSSQLRDSLNRLYQRGKLARFVIDEAHCVSQWGHDFRPDYKQLGFLKESYPTVPIMALTATANEAVQKDVLFNLKITNCKMLKQSFNRNNLMYEVVPKNKEVLQDMKNFIKARPRQSGIIYCCTKKDCEQVAEKLQKIGVSIKHYHAGLSTAERSQVQREWQTGQIQVIAATIAFGMGIDKPDVRFVLHYSVPSSVEGYYQETGRAGRDGQLSVCRLYFGYGDTRTHQYLIDQGDGSFEQKQRQRDNLNTMMRFCDNQTDCRRKQILSYFGENFTAAECNKMCDNCIQNQKAQSVFKDMSRDASTLIRLVQDILPERITIAQLTEIYRGSRARRIKDHGHDQLEGWGKGRSKDRSEVDRILRAMILDDAIREKSECNAKGFPVTYLTLSNNAESVLNGRTKILVSFVQDSVRNTVTSTVAAVATTSTTRRNGTTTRTTTTAGFVSAGTISTSNGRRAAPTTQPDGRRVLPSPTTSTGRASSSTTSKKPSPEDERVLRCVQEMQKLRQAMMVKLNLRTPSSILTDTSLKQIAKKLPLNEREFLLVTNMKDTQFERLGKPFLDVAIKYHNLNRRL